MADSKPTTDPKPTKAIVLYFAALIGALLAALSDLIQKGDASALKTITQAFREVLLVDITPIAALVCVLLIGVALCFVFDPKTKEQSFTRSLGVIAFLVTAVPYKEPPDLQSEVNATERTALWLMPRVMAAPPEQEAGARQRAQVEVRLVPRAGELRRSTITLSDPSTKKILAQSVTANSSVLFPRSPGTYVLRVDSQGFRPVTDTVVVADGWTRIEVPLDPSTLPVLGELLPPKKGDYVVKTLPPRDVASVASTVTVKNTSARLSATDWGWTIFVEGPEDVLSRIDCVEYTLHPTFRDRIQRVCARGEGPQAFSLAARGWGTFQVGVRVLYKDGTSRNLTHQLLFE
jgi:hypothetical protein